eukprot:1461732-Amphidinium_carterae.1
MIWVGGCGCGCSSVSVYTCVCLSACHTYNDGFPTASPWLCWWHLCTSLPWRDRLRWLCGGGGGGLPMAG